MDRLQPGDVLEDRYTIVRPIAEGGMSAVYEVKDSRLPGRLVAKQMRPSMLGQSMETAQLEQLFRREAEVLSKLSHPFLPKVTDYFESEGRRFLVEELVEGKTLEAWTQNPESLREYRVVGWALQICQALPVRGNRLQLVLFSSHLRPHAWVLQWYEQRRVGLTALV